MQKETHDAYLAILREELLPATGCTEPIAIAYCASVLRELLGTEPEHIDAIVSGNILKNVKSVVVPNTNGMKGIPAAIAAGIIAGQRDKELQVISSVSEEQKKKIGEYIENTPMRIRCGDSPCMLDICLTGYLKEHVSTVRITNNHTNIVYIKKDEEILLDLPIVASAEDHLQDKSILNVHDIVRFADSANFEELKSILETQILCNSAIAKEGLRGNWGSQIGKTLLKQHPEDIAVRAQAYAAAGSDARMSGCEMPVVILSGSGNQGLTASLPIICYAQSINASADLLYRALAVSDLITIHQKTGIGRLSAYCGAVSAGIGAGAGIAYMMNTGIDGVSHTIINAAAILSGTICDGAKPSCAAKISAAVSAGILGYQMYVENNNFQPGDGILGNDVEEVITHVGILASQGMKETDQIILKIMTN